MDNRIYTNKDMESVRQSLIDSAIIISEGKWTDFNSSDSLGASLIELMAGTVDMINFELDHKALECYIDTVKQRRNGVALFALINYKLGLTNSSVALGKFYLDSEYPEDIIIPKYTQVSAILPDRSKIFYATKTDTTIRAGELETTVSLVQGKVMKSTIKLDTLRNNQKITILTENIAEGSLTITLDGSQWIETDNVVIDDIEGRKYSVFEDKDCRPVIFFHNSYRKFIPQDDSKQMELVYLVSDGTKGNIKANMVTQIESFIYSSTSQNLSIDTLKVTNIEAFSGGSARETLDEARIQAPKQLSTMNHAVTLEDFNTLALGLSGVLKCSALDWYVDSSYYVNVPYLVQMYLVPKGGGDLSTGQLNEISTYFADKKLSTVRLEIYSANYVQIDIHAKVYALVDENNKESLRLQIIKNIEEYFKPERRDFGYGVQNSNLVTLIQTSSQSINYVDLIFPTNDFNLNKTQFPVLGEVEIEIERSIITWNN